MSTDSNNMGVEINNTELELKLQGMLDWIPKEAMKEIINVYYTLKVQSTINDKKYGDLVKLEWLLDLYNLLDREI